MPRRVPKRAVNVREYPLRDINRREGRAIQFSMPYPPDLGSSNNFWNSPRRLAPAERHGSVSEK